MPKHGPEVPLSLRAGILALHLFTDKNFVEISTHFNVHPETARKICKRAKERAADDSVRELFAALADRNRSGRPKKIIKNQGAEEEELAIGDHGDQQQEFPEELGTIQQAAGLNGTLALDLPRSGLKITCTSSTLPPDFKTTSSSSSTSEERSRELEGEGFEA